MLEDFMDTEFCMLAKDSREDEFGDVVEYYKDSTHFMAGMQRNGSNEMLIAEQNGVNAVYTLVSIKSLPLVKNDRIKRISDNAIFEVTDEPIQPPKVATRSMQHYEFNLRRVKL